LQPTNQHTDQRQTALHPPGGEDWPNASKRISSVKVAIRQRKKNDFNGGSFNQFPKNARENP